MKVSRLNLLTALLSLAGALIALFFGEVFAGLLWLAISVVWLLLAVLKARKPDYEGEPLQRLRRRLWRMLLWS